MTLARVKLECFDTADDAVPIESADYQRGFSEAVAQAQRSQDAERENALTKIASTLEDMTFGFVEARVHIMAQIQPLLAQVAEVILPAVAQQTFASHLVEILEKQFDDASDLPVLVCVAPEDFDNLKVTFSAQPSNFTLVSDPTVTLGQALLRRHTTHIMIDFPALLDALQTALRGFESTERNSSNG